jgi:hypothetical protein
MRVTMEQTTVETRSEDRMRRHKILDDENRDDPCLICPYCGGTDLHQLEVRVYDRSEDDEMVRRAIITGTMDYDLEDDDEMLPVLPGSSPRLRPFLTEVQGIRVPDGTAW